MTTKSKPNSRQSRKAKREAQLRRDALLLFKTIHDESISEDVRDIVEEYVQDIYTQVPETWPVNNKPLFVMGFVKGWQRQDTAYARRNVGEILRRLKAGESAETVIGEWEGKREERRQQAELDALNAPEPKDRKSNEWRYWKLRQMESSFDGEGGPDEARAAWTEFFDIARQAINGAMYKRYHAMQMLPHFIIMIQEMDETEKPQKSRQARAEQDADLLFDIMNSNAGGNSGEPVYEFGCVLDAAMNAAGSIYTHRDIFRQLYIAEEVGKDDDVKAIVRALRRGVSAIEIARQLGEGTFNERRKLKAS